MLSLMTALRGKPEEYHHSLEADSIMYNFMKLYPLDTPLPAGPVLHTTAGPIKVSTYAEAVTYDYAGQRVILHRKHDGCYPVVSNSVESKAMELTWDTTDSRRNPEELYHASISHNRGHVAEMKWTKGPLGDPLQIGYRNYTKHQAWFFTFHNEQPVWCCDS